MGRTKNSAFAGYHPAVNFLFFALVLAYTMFLLHPLCLGISLGCALSYLAKLKGGGNTGRFCLIFLLPLLIAAALINPAFNHAGITILFYLHNGNAVTLEAVIYGLAAATMLLAVICWFSCYNQVVTADKFVYLFGRIIPGLSLIFAIVLRLVPRFKAEAKAISYAQSCVGEGIGQGKIYQRIKHALRIVSILITWALENCIDTADSMKARGYGLPKRSAFSIYVLDKRDKRALAVIVLLGLMVTAGALAGAFASQYFPAIILAESSPFTAAAFTAYLCLSALPLALEIMEDCRWKHSLSKT